MATYNKILCAHLMCQQRGSAGRFGTACRFCGEIYGHHLPKKVKKALKRSMATDGRVTVLSLGEVPNNGQDVPPGLPLRPATPDPVTPVELSPAMLRQALDYRPWFEDEPLNLTKPISYIMGSNGIMEVRRSKVGVTARLVNQVPGLVTIAEGLTLSVPKVPWELIRQTVVFFRAVSQQKGSCEAFVQYWYQPDVGYSVFVPKQDVGGAHVHVKAEDNYPPNAAALIHVCDCHSHGSGMDAFFSGTDDSDERAKGDRLYMVIGKVLDENPQIRIRAVAGHGFLAVTPTEVIEAPTARLTLTGETSKGKESTLIGYAADPFHDATFPRAWMDQLIEEKPLAWAATWEPLTGEMDPRLPAYYRGSDTWTDVADKRLKSGGSLRRKTANAPFLPGTAFEDYVSSDGVTYRVYANGYCETLTEADGHAITKN